MPDLITFEKLQEYADTLEEDYIVKLEEQKKMQDDLKNFSLKFDAHRVETAFQAASWRGLSDFAKKHFGKELASKASKPDETVEADDKSEKKAEL